MTHPNPFHLLRFLLICAGALVFQPAIGQENMDDQRPLRSPRVFNPVPCHHYRHARAPRTEEAPAAPRWMMNYDMSESIARSDSFDVATYALDLDVTEYNLHQLTAHATIGFNALNSEATDLWFDLVELTVDSVHLNGMAIGFEHGEFQLHVDAPELGWETDSHV